MIILPVKRFNTKHLGSSGTGRTICLRRFIASLNKTSRYHDCGVQTPLQPSSFSCLHLQFFFLLSPYSHHTSCGHAVLFCTRLSARFQCSCMCVSQQSALRQISPPRLSDHTLGVEWRSYLQPFTVSPFQLHDSDWFLLVHCGPCGGFFFFPQANKILIEKKKKVWPWLSQRAKNWRGTNNESSNNVHVTLLIAEILRMFPSVQVYIAGYFDPTYLGLNIAVIPVFKTLGWIEHNLRWQNVRNSCTVFLIFTG